MKNETNQNTPVTKPRKPARVIVSSLKDIVLDWSIINSDNQEREPLGEKLTKHIFHDLQ